MPTDITNTLDEDPIVFPSPTPSRLPGDFQPIFEDRIAPSPPPSYGNNNNTTLDVRNYDNGGDQLPLPNTGCRTEYQTIFDIEEVETEEQICNTIFE